MTGKVKILVIEDEVPAAMIMARALSQAGCEVLIAHTGKRGLELAQENKFDLILLNFDSPIVGGLEICRELKQRHAFRHTPIIFISGQFSEKTRLHGLELGAADCITRPLDATDFVRRILAHTKAKNNSGEPIQSAEA